MKGTQEVYCHKCYVYFAFTGVEKNCPQCKARLNDWHIIKQLRRTRESDVRALPYGRGRDAHS